jgi:catechol 2,3-dioxygenase-like lactoylglutathione lyase family enzyme
VTRRGDSRVRSRRIDEEKFSVFEGIGDVFLPVADLNRALEWYTSVVGFRPFFRDDEHGSAGLSSGNGVGLCLVQVEEHQPLQFPSNDFRTDITFNLRSSDIDGTYRTLKDRGVDVEEIEESLDGTFRCFAFTDPDGNRISVVSG